MDLHPLETALLGVAAFVFVVYRQLRPQPVDAAGGARRPLVFGAVGVLLAGQYVLHHRITALGAAGLVVSLAVAAVLAHLRGRSVRLWRRDGAWWRRGTAVTLVLWFCSIGTHLGVDALVGVLDPAEGIGKGLGNATLLLYLGVSLGLQHLVVVHRARRLPVPDAAAHAEAPAAWTSRLAG